MPESLTPDEYQPRILGTGQSPTLPVTEFVIVGKDQLQALTALLGVLREHNVGLLGLESQSMPATKHFVITTFADMRNSDCGLEEMLETLRRVLAVDSVKGADLEGSAYDRFLFPVVALDGSRLITSPVQNIVEVEGYFSTLSYDAGNLLMFATGRQSGLALVRSLRRSHAGEFQNEMLGMAVDELRTSGWGIFAFDVGALESGTVTVLVRDPINKGVPEATESWLTYGMSAGIIEGIYGMVGNISSVRSYSAKRSELKFKIIELRAGQVIDGVGR